MMLGIGSEVVVAEDLEGGAHAIEPVRLREQRDERELLSCRRPVDEQPALLRAGPGGLKVGEHGSQPRRRRWLLGHAADEGGVVRERRGRRSDSLRRCAVHDLAQPGDRGFAGRVGRRCGRQPRERSAEAVAQPLRPSHSGRPARRGEHLVDAVPAGVSEAGGC